MRILHVISSAAAGGAEIYVRDLSIEMVKAGHKVFILFLDRATEAGRDGDFEARFLREIEFHGIEYGFIGASARKKPWRGISKINGVVSEFSPDIVHCHLYYAAIFSLFVKNAKVVYTHHNIRLGAKPIIYKLLDMKVSRYIGICQACKELLESVSRKKVIRIDNGVTPTRIKKRLRGSEEKSGNVVKLISVGRLSEQKNLVLLISSLAKLVGARYQLKIAGEGPLRESLEKLANDKGISAHIEFLGNVSNVDELLYEADVFVMSSAWEGLPIAQIEATLSGLPVIVTNVGGCAEIVHKACNGIVVDELDEESYARALEKMLTNVRLLQLFSHNALTYSGDYLIKTSADKHIALYKEVMTT
ncbi:glycosyltransferase family 4 protein [Halovibrio sp. HP20-50]|uniref:glycosyltransferase family 4 protein n=1 Tax=Halovibrio sp. HP20-59 TaxID=3080275 RepID=UPI00294AB011|nr:glycosyltransferase family 4 protein [Halovibrio sp. HP20-59]MEA2120513.1 glycosyltransferase family 4 protein [Halovibrio sp. HP20-59]